LPLNIIDINEVKTQELSTTLSYDSFFPRHSFGAVPLGIYDEFIPDGSGNGCVRIKSLDIDKTQLALQPVVFLIPQNYWQESLGEANWKNFDFFKNAFVSGLLAKGNIVIKNEEVFFRIDQMICGASILSPCWGANGIRHVDFVERAVPIPEDDDGFHDYTRRWRERELRDRGYDSSSMDSSEYHDLFMRVNGPIRYHFFLPEEAGNEPDCYFHSGRIFLPEGFPIVEDLLAEKIENTDYDEYWGPAWKDPIYPNETSLWMWVTRKDRRLKNIISVTNRSGRITLQLVPFYFSLII
jgi:hypothetical protein